MFFNPLRFIGKTGSVVIISFLILVAALVLVIQASSRPPVIESISPEIGLPGDVLVITGRNFGTDRAQNRVRISGRIPTASAYLEWTDRIIRLRLPVDSTSGLVYVYTGNGRSNGVLFTNSEHLPERVAPVRQPGRPVITGIDPTVSRVGDVITIHGRRFGENRKTSRVLFAWSSEGQDNPGRTVWRTGSVEGSASDFAYELWSERMIRVRVPNGATTGEVMVQTDKGLSPPVTLQVDQPVGRKVFANRRQFAVHYSISIDQVETDPSLGDWNRLYIWKPRVQSLPEQREVQVISRSGEPLFEDISGLTVYEFSDLALGSSYLLSATVIFDRYEVLTEIEASRVPVRYTIDERFTRKYLAESGILPVRDPAIVNAARQVAGRTQNPYLKAQLLYNWVLDRLEPEDREASRRPVDALESRVGNAYSYATLYASLLRASGVPARVIAGHLFDIDGQAIRHYWTEFFLQGFGWVPADPSLGDGLHAPRLPERAGARAFYFGNIDAYRVTFSAGLMHGRNLHIDGTRRSVAEMYSIQTHYEEAVGNLVGYRSRWFDVMVLGEYR
jgi:transglutaminase-like putative cysteine protease